MCCFCGFTKSRVEKKYGRPLEEPMELKRSDVWARRGFPLIRCLVVFVCAGREPRQKNASITPGWTRIPTRTSTRGPRWTSTRWASRSPRAPLRPPSRDWSSDLTSYVRGKASWRRAATPSLLASPRSSRGLKSSRGWRADPRRGGRDWMHWNSTAQTLGAATPAGSPGPRSARLPLLLWRLWAELLVVWYSVDLNVCHSVLIWTFARVKHEDWSKNKSGIWCIKTLLHDCTATEVNRVQLNSSFPSALMSFTLSASWAGFQSRNDNI